MGIKITDKNIITICALFKSANAYFNNKHRQQLRLTINEAPQNFSKPFFAPLFVTTLRTLKRTVFERRRHSPMTTESPTLTLKQETRIGCLNVQEKGNKPKCGRTVSAEIFVSLLVTAIFRHVMKVVATHNNCSRHFRFEHATSEDLASYRDVCRERALFVDVRAFDGLKIAAACELMKNAASKYKAVKQNGKLRMRFLCH